MPLKWGIIVAFVVTRSALVVLALNAFLHLPHLSGPEYRNISSNPLVALWHRWDAGFFTRIALHGYGWQAGHATGDMTFMPLYPALIRVSLIPYPQADHANATVAGILLSNLCLLASLFVFDALLALDTNDLRLRRLAVWLFLMAPVTLFFSAVYTESLYFLLSLLAIYAARRARWAVAGLAGLLAAFTRVMGWTLFLPLLYEAWRQRKGRTLPRWGYLLAAGAPLLAVPLYAGIVGFALGDWNVYLKTTRAVWEQGFGNPARAFADFLGGSISLYGWRRSLVDLVFTLLFLALSVPAFRWRPGYGLYTLAVVGFPVAAGTLISMPRYVAVAFPAYAIVAQWVRSSRWRAALVLAGSALLAAVFAARFVTWRWIA